MIRSALALLAAAATFTIAAAANALGTAANLLNNGGFEQPVVGVGSYQLFSTGQSFPGWKVVGAAGNVAPISTAFTQSGSRFVGKEGHQWLDLTGLSNTPTGVSQTVKTAPGATYRLTFAVGNVVDPGGTFGNSSTVRVLVNGRRILNATNKGRGTTQSWKTFAVTVKATSAATTIAFLNGDARTDNDDGLDAVALTRR